MMDNDREREHDDEDEVGQHMHDGHLLHEGDTRWDTYRLEVEYECEHVDDELVEWLE